VLLSIYSVTGTAMRSMLDSYTLADVAHMARGQRTWPSEAVAEARMSDSEAVTN